MVALDLQNVQTVAYQEGWKLILLSYESRVISFRKEEGNDDGSNSNWNCGYMFRSSKTRKDAAI